MTLSARDKPKDPGHTEWVFIAASFTAIFITLAMIGGVKIILMIVLSAVALLAFVIGVERLNRYLDRF